MRQALWAAAAFAVGLLVAVAAAPRPEATGLDAASVDERRDDGAPTWDVGDAWRVQFADSELVCWLVVVRANEAGSEQGVWCPTGGSDDVATQIAVFSVPYLGRFGPSLEGITREGETRWYDWPLEDGKTWTTQYEGIDVSVGATADDEGRWTLSMVRADGSATLATYDYDPALEWWSILAFESGYTLRVHERERGWDGRVAYAEAQPRGEADSALLTTDAFTFEADEEDELVALLVRRPVFVAEHLQLVAPDGGFAFFDLVAPFVNNAPFQYSLTDSEAGTWELRRLGVGTSSFSVAAFTVRTHEVALGGS